MRTILLVVACITGSLPASGGPQPENALQNPGFETVENETIAVWQIPEYWSGSLVSMTEPGMVRNGNRSARLTAEEKLGRHWGRVLQPVRERGLFGRRFRCSVWAKGRGDFLLGCIEYRSPAKFKPHYRYRWQDAPVQLGPDWREIIFEVSMPDPEVRSLTVTAEVRGEGSEAFLDDVSFVRLVEPGVVLRAEPSHVMVEPGRVIEIKVFLEKNGEAMGQEPLTVIAGAPEQEPVSSELRISAEGTAVFPFKATGDSSAGNHLLVFAHSPSGVVAESSVDVVDEKTWAAFAAAAERVKIAPRPLRLLFIGDSLTDQQRGFNYVDKLGFWLSRSHAPGVTWRNAGVGGDYISRVWQRMKGDPDAYRRPMYDKLFEPEPTHVFFFLGHNDSKVSSTSGYTQQSVDPDTFEEQYRKAIRKVQAETDAKVIVMSATSSVYDICKANAEKRKATGNAHTLFGKPEELERFNAIARRVAADLGCDWVDVYEPTRTHADKPSLFNPRDGVHLSAEGNRFIALELLKYFGRADEKQ